MIKTILKRKTINFLIVIINFELYKEYINNIFVTLFQIIKIKNFLLNLENFLIFISIE